MGQQLCLSWLLLLVLTLLLAQLRWHRIGHWLLLGWLLLSGGLFLVELWLLLSYHSLLDGAMVQIALATNGREALEFISLRLRDMALAGLLFVLSVGIAWFLQRGLRQLLAWKHDLSVLLAVLLFFGGGWVQYKDPEVIEYCLSIERLSDMLYCLYDEMSSYDKISQGLAAQRIQLTYNESRIPYVVFILGESTSRHHMGIYGYSLDTTPRLQRRQQAGELRVFSDTISPHTYTMAVLRELFSFYHKEYGGEWYDYPDYFDILRQAGYHTVWLSNQESSGIYGNAGRAYADRCDAKAFTQIRDSQNPVSRLDEAILPLLDDSLADHAAEKNFYVLHLMGTHEDYVRRYPGSFAVFTSEDEAGDKPEWRKIRAEYDNAVRYNDFIVDEIIRRFEDKNAVVIYVSDHGEEVYDRWGFRGHAEHGSYYQLEIPMLVWTSPAFESAFPRLSGRLWAAVHQPFMTNDMIDLLMDLMELQTQEYDSSRSPLQPDYDAGRPRLYEGSTYKRTAE